MSGRAAVDPVADLIEKYVGEDGRLRETEGRLKFHKVDDAQVKPMPPPREYRCLNGGRPIRIEAKEGTYVHWGLMNNVKTGGVSFTQNTPKGTHVTTIANHIYYTACEMNQQLVEALLKVACDESLRATHVIINSAFRDPIHNLLEGGRSASQHLTCRAIDFSLGRASGPIRNQRELPRIPPREVQAVAGQFALIRGLGKGLSFTHVDNRPGERAAWNYGPKVAEAGKSSENLMLSLSE